MQKTIQPKKAEIKRDWHLIDANGKVLGRISTEIVKFLMGKNKLNYAPHMDMGDKVVVINAEKIVLTGKKEKQKLYRSHSGYPGGFKEVKFKKMKEDHPERIIEIAVKRMLPENRLRDKRLRRLFVFKGENQNLYKVN
ncbi:MAG: 50S ribosomal protein L13 [Candidatus Woesebacteria bacterium]|nr:MAG: 50S ribosomal protein L13 [Candidatus Woesebacteria bacterium]